MRERRSSAARFTIPFLQPGLHVRVVAPCSPFDAEDLLRGVERLRARYVVSHDDGLFERTGYLAGDDARRTRELVQAIDDPSVHAIVAARGGYGAARLLPLLDARRVAQAKKLLVGFSDVTALHALWARAELGSIHGPMAAALGRTSEALLARFVRAIEGTPPATLGGLVPMAGGVARGRLFGGNLAVLSSLLGTPYLPSLEGVVLFLEDVGERPYRVDRMLTSLLQSGALDRVAAVALGAFTKAEPAADQVTVEHVLAERLCTLGVPVVRGVPAGHVEDNLELPLGQVVEVDADHGTLSFSS